MPLPLDYNLPKTKNSSEFEGMVCDVCKIKFGGDFQRFGRLGQSQCGIDIISMDLEELICIQCKNYDITLSHINKIISEAMNFTLPISKFIIATSSFRDTKLQEYVLKINQEKDYKFVVYIIFWEEISSIISQNNDLLNKYYHSMNRLSSEWMVVEFNQLINKYDVLGFIKVDPIIGMPKHYPGEIDMFVLEVQQMLERVNVLQQDPKFIVINQFYDVINDYNLYLSSKLFSANAMYTIQNQYDLLDISKKNSEIRNRIFSYKKKLDDLYSQINDGCSMFFVAQYI